MSVTSWQRALAGFVEDINRNTETVKLFWLAVISGPGIDVCKSRAQLWAKNVEALLRE
jgi:hypothetical protein